MQSVLVFGMLLTFYATDAFDNEPKEPMCLSRFDFDYKVLTKLVALENVLGDMERTQREMGESIGLNKNAVSELKTYQDQWTAAVKSLQTAQKDAQSGPTYIRWGRSSCPGNGTELVYTGYTAGSDFESTGSSANHLCLPEEPVWGKYDDATQEGALVHGTQYEYGGRSSLPFVTTSIDDQLAPCSVCQTKRSSAMMIPGRNKCFDGWTLEYYGYLFGQRSTNKASFEYICVDVDAETVGHGTPNDHLLYIAEIRCSSLPCPPYVDGRELTCVVCSK